MHAPVPGITREISRPVTIDGITFPKFSRLSVSIYALHHNPHVWGEDHMVKTLNFCVFEFDINLHCNTDLRIKCVCHCMLKFIMNFF